MKTRTSSPAETMELGQKIASRLRGGEVLALTGNLGSGKTIFVKGLAKGLKFKQIINSPTFVLMKVYGSQSKSLVKIKYLIHVDAYRLNSSQELIDIGLKDWLGKKDAVVVIEWANRVKAMLSKLTIWIKIKNGREDNLRIFDIN